MKALFRSLGAGIMIWTASFTPAHAQSATAWKALHYAAQNVWFCNIVQPYPGFEDGFIRPKLELHFEPNGEQPKLTGTFTEQFQQYGANGSVASANYGFDAHVFDTPQEGTGIYVESSRLLGINRNLDRPLAWQASLSWIRFQILPGENGTPYRIIGTDGDGADYTCGVGSPGSVRSPVESKLVNLHATLDSVVEELGAAHYYDQQGNMREQACQAARSAQNKLDQADNEIREISNMISSSDYNDADRANWAEQLGPLQSSIRDGKDAAMNYWSATC